MGRVIPLTQRAERRERPGENGHRTLEYRPVHGWDVNAVVALSIDETFPPTTACTRWLIRVDPLRRTWEVIVMREGWQHSATFQGDDAASALRLLNELLSASYGVPA